MEYEYASIAGLIGYVIPVVVYITHIHGDWFNILKNIILTTGFAIIAFTIGRKVIAKRKPEHGIQVIAEYPSNIGYALLAVYFILLIGPNMPLYYWIAIGAYIAIALKQKIGVYLMIAFYVISLALSATSGTSGVGGGLEGVVLAASKALLVFYFVIEGGLMKDAGLTLVMRQEDKLLAREMAT